MIECWPSKCQTPGKVFSTFVLTDEHGHKYGAAVSFYERYEFTALQSYLLIFSYKQSLTQEQLRALGLTEDDNESAGCADNSSTNDPTESMTFSTNHSICVVSRYPFFNAFKRYKMLLRSQEEKPLSDSSSIFIA